MRVTQVFRREVLSHTGVNWETMSIGKEFWLALAKRIWLSLSKEIKMLSSHRTKPFLPFDWSEMLRWNACSWIILLPALVIKQQSSFPPSAVFEGKHLVVWVQGCSIHWSYFEVSLHSWQLHLPPWTVIKLNAYLYSCKSLHFKQRDEIRILNGNISINLICEIWSPLHVTFYKMCRRKKKN